MQSPDSTQAALMDPLVECVLWGIAAGLIGARKREGTLAFVAGLLCGPLGVVCALASSGRRRP
jgi:hypothetical protein